jgi:hypothetical protein
MKRKGIVIPTIVLIVTFVTLLINNLHFDLNAIRKIDKTHYLINNSCVVDTEHNTITTVPKQQIGNK